MLPYIEIYKYQISMYAVCIMAGLIFGIIVALLRAGIYQYKKEDILFASFYGILGLISGGKILYLITIIPFLVKNFEHIINSREILQALMSGGFVFYGGLLGAVAGIWIYTKQYHLKIQEVLEIMIPSVPLIHALGRVGCFCAGCCYGREFPKPLGMIFHNSPIAPNDVPLFPVQLVEAGGNLFVFIILLWCGRRRTSGQLTGIYFIAYSIMRFLLEYMRADAERGIWLGISTSQWISIGIMAAGIMIMKKAGKK